MRKNATETMQQPTACAPLAATSEVERQATIARALADPTRLRMLELMVQGRGCCDLPAPAARGVPGADDPAGICVCEFQEQFSLAQSKTSYHLRVLRDAGLIGEETRGKWTFYHLEREVAETALRTLGGILGS
jgi:ArsR family transcriptional regulator